MLIGYRAGVNYVITELIGPGPSATHGKDRFVPDAAWQFERLEDEFAASRGVHRYLGDWHTHPEGPAALSLLDRRTLARIARGSATGEPHPLMLVGSGLGGAWTWRVHIHIGAVAALWARTCDGELRLYDVPTPQGLST
jgi:integrative and conjugative element protein (TIGR02256 family)